MTKLFSAMAAVLIVMGGFSVLGSGHAPPTIQTKTVGTETYLVDREGKALYTFVPSGLRAIPLASDWQEPSKTWVQHWRPLHVGDGETLEWNAEDLEGHVFTTVPKAREGGIENHVHWGGENTRSVPFWGLYTFVDDAPLETYSLEDLDFPPGRVLGIWRLARVAGAPEPGNSAMIDLAEIRLGDESGSTSWGGP